MAAAIGGVTATMTAGSPASSTTPASSTPASSAPATGSAAVRTAQALVGGKTETILVDSRGLPLYFYRPDTATQSLVSGQLAVALPPLTAATPGVAPVAGTAAPTGTAPATPSGGGYGY